MARHLQPILLNRLSRLFAVLVILALAGVTCSSSNPPATAESSSPFSTVTKTVVPSPISYLLKHNPFAYFDSIRNNPERYQHDMVPLTDLDTDLQNGTLPDYAFITPNLCHSAHDWYTDPKCPIKVADDWLGTTVNKLSNYTPLKENTLIVLTWDEGQGNHGCCGMDVADGRVATILISSLAKAAFQDATPYIHYSLLKTIETAWGMPLLGHAADPQMVVIEPPWK